ncbi:MAG: hypothetical protein A2330_05835 [Ignavibacteria bacterium RIFOXYB2_FULL_36_7]|nr:MAG: hypothetical protein A2330_05835 [Ignavibacteria bacterium RIFOXYB2_FULL_36_7]
MQAIQIKILNKEKLFINWDDKSESTISLKYLRDECPCANCKGETVLLKTYRPPKPTTTNPDMYKIKSIDAVGGYAIQIVWKDNHNTGIYSWEYLKKLDKDQDNNTSQNYNNII